MISPIRCFTCGKEISSLWESFEMGCKVEHKGTVLDQLNIKRVCCRRMFMGHVNLIDKLLQFEMSKQSESL